jgi:hypothetical protein
MAARSDGARRMLLRDEHRGRTERRKKASRAPDYGTAAAYVVAQVGFGHLGKPPRIAVLLELREDVIGDPLLEHWLIHYHRPRLCQASVAERPVAPRTAKRSALLMSQNDEHRRMAAECRLQAKLSITRLDRQQWLRLAENWLKLAEVVERERHD